MKKKLEDLDVSFFYAYPAELSGNDFTDHLFDDETTERFAWYLQPSMLCGGSNIREKFKDLIREYVQLRDAIKNIIEEQRDESI